MKTAQQFACLCALHVAIPSGGQWTTLNSGTEETILTISRTPNGTLRAMGNDFRESTDGGDTWTSWEPTLLGLSPLVGGYFRDIVWTSELDGFMVGGMETNNQHVILRTNDGGHDWSGSDVVNTGGWPQFNTRIEFPTWNVGYACGTFGLLVKSSNSGADWTTMGTGTAENIYGMHFWNANNGIVLSRTDIRRTTNGAVNWTQVATGDELRGLGWLPTGEMFAAGNFSFLNSNDQGATWTTHPAPFGAVTDVLALNTDTILVAGDGIWITRDGGQWWEHFPAPANGQFNQMRTLDTQTIVAAGAGGAIIRTSNISGPSLPTPQFDHTVAYACGEAVLDLTANCDPALGLTWLVDGVPISTDDALSITYTAAINNDQIALVADNDTFTDTMFWNASVQVDQPITLDAGPDVYQCYGAIAQLQASGADSYSWSPATSLSSTVIPNPTTTTAVPITYTVSGTSGLCSALDSVHVQLEPNQAPDSWITLLSTTEADNAFWTMHWPDDLNGYVMCSENLLITHDGGANWETHAHDLSFNFTLLDLEMVDATIGYMSAAGSGVLKTMDGGINWSAVNDPLWSALDIQFWCVEFLNADTGFAVANHDSGLDPRIFRTVNGGAEWEQIYAAAGRRLMALAVLDWETLIAVGGYGNNPPRIVRTADAGASWTDTLHAAGERELDEIVISPNGHVVALGSEDEFRSWDAGATWQRRSYAAGAKGEIAFTAADTAYCADGSTVYKSINGGECYQQVQMAMPNAIGAIRASGPGRAHVACRLGQNNGTLIRSTGDFPTRTTTPMARAQEELQAWYSSADRAIHVRFPSQWSSADLSLLDALGRSVAERLWQGVGGEIQLAAAGLSPGRYVIRAISADQVRSTNVLLY